MSPSEAKDLCLYCNSAAKSLGSDFCCEACSVLYRLSQESTPGGSRPLRPETEEDRLLKKHYAETRGKNELWIRLEVEKLACEACLFELKDLPLLLPEVRQVDWDAHHSVLGLELSHPHASLTRVFEVLKDMGLKPRWVSPEELKKRKNTQNTSLRRMAIAGGLLGNIMLFAIPIYSGLQGELKNLFLWIQGLLFLPVFTWVAWPFYRTAYWSLRFRSLHTDLPLTLAFFVGSLMSYLGLVRGQESWVYFDSLAGFLFLILLSRYLLERSLSGHMQLSDPLSSFDRPFWRVLPSPLPPSQSNQIVKNHASLKSLFDLKKGDIIELKSGQRLPASATQLDPEASWDQSWMTGEMLPQKTLAQYVVKGGALLISPESLRLRLEETPEQSEFWQLLQELRVSASRPLTNTLEGQLGQTLVIVSFVLAIGLFFLLGHQVEEWLRRSLSLWIIACPCAVSFAAPLSRASGAALAPYLGFWIKDPLALDRLTQVKKIALDKTGTLTEPHFVLSEEQPLIDAYLKQIILSLELRSEHPIAKALVRSFGHLQALPVTDWKELPGLGVEGNIEGSRWELKKAQDGTEGFELRKNGQLLLRLRLEESLPPQVAESLRQLQSRYQIYILSGDHPDRVKKMAKRIPLPEENVFGHLSPEQKKEILEKISPEIYVGDGTNDLKALSRAPVSMSLGGASLESQKVSQIIIISGGLRHIERLFRLAREVRGLLRRNLSLALTYNIIAGLAAVLGWIGPLEAAVLMPISSIVLLISTQSLTPWLRQIRRQSQKGVPT